MRMIMMMVMMMMMMMMMMMIEYDEWAGSLNGKSLIASFHAPRQMVVDWLLQQLLLSF